MENLKNITPVEDFNWDAYENGEAVTSMSHEDLEKAYDGTLNKVNSLVSWFCRSLFFWVYWFSTVAASVAKGIVSSAAQSSAPSPAPTMTMTMK